MLGSAGPIRFVVNEEELVAAVIDTALKSYAREGRLPVLGNNTTGFVLYCPHLGSDGTFFQVLNPTLSVYLIGLPKLFFYLKLNWRNWCVVCGCELFLEIELDRLFCCGCKIFSEN